MSQTYPYATLRRAADRIHEAESWRVRADIPHAPDRARLLLESLDLVAAATADLETMTRDTVDELRDAGASWSTIGAALGVTKQAATQRFGRKGDQVAGDDGPTLLDELEGARCPHGRSTASRRANPCPPGLSACDLEGAGE